MNTAQIKGYAMTAAGVLLTLLVINTLANRVAAIKPIRDKVMSGL